MVSVRALQADTDGATADWLLLSAGIMLLGMFAVYELFVGSTNQLISEMNGESMTEPSPGPSGAGSDEAPAIENQCNRLAAFDHEERCADQMGG